MNTRTKSLVHYSLLALVLVTALGIRVPHFRCLIPYFYHEDEMRTVGVTLKMFQDRTLDPHFSLYPGLPFYLNGAVYAGYFFSRTARTCLEARSLEPLFHLAESFSERSKELILLSRGLSLAFGLFSVIAVYLLGREFLDREWGLLSAVFYALIPAHITLSYTAKVDILLQFFIAMGWLFQFRLIRTGRFQDYAWAAVFSALTVITKLNYGLFISFFFAALFRAVVENQQGILSTFLDRRFLGAGLVATATLFLASPYWFWDLGNSLKVIGWLYWMSAWHSFYHIDPHHWWLDRYFYNYLLVMPFLMGIPLYLVAILGATESIRRVRWKPEMFLFGILIGFAYIWPSQAEGSYPYYIHLYMAPPLVIFASSFLKSLWEKRSAASRRCAGLLIIALLAVGICRMNSYYRFSIANFDNLGPWVSANIPANSHALLFSVYLPGKALGIAKVERTWPQDLTPEMLAEKSPDYIFLDTWTFGGFKKFYKDTTAVERHLNALLTGKSGYQVIKCFRAQSFMDKLYQRMDPEHDVELIVLRRESTLPGGGDIP
jgi:hypothetical protein